MVPGASAVRPRVGELAEHQVGEFPEHFSLSLGELIERRHFDERNQEVVVEIMPKRILSHSSGNSEQRVLKSGPGPFVPFARRWPWLRPAARERLPRS